MSAHPPYLTREQIDAASRSILNPIDRDADTAQRYEDAVGREIAVVGRILIALLACLTTATLILSVCWSAYYSPAAALCAFGLGYSIPRRNDE